MKKEILKLAGLGVALVGGCVASFAVGRKTAVKKYKGELTIGDLGVLGEAFMEHDGELTKDTKIVGIGKFVFDCEEE